MLTARWTADFEPILASCVEAETSGAPWRFLWPDAVVQVSSALSAQVIDQTHLLLAQAFDDELCKDLSAQLVGMRPI